MIECVWHAMMVCSDKCKCDRYIAVNSDNGKAIETKWETQVREILIMESIKFAKENGFEMEDKPNDNQSTETTI